MLNQTLDGEKLTFDRAEAARRLGISMVTLDRELARSRITHLRIGRRVLFTLDHLTEYIDKNTRSMSRGKTAEQVS